MEGEPVPRLHGEMDCFERALLDTYLTNRASSVNRYYKQARFAEAEEGKEERVGFPPIVVSTTWCFLFRCLLLLYFHCPHRVLD